MTLTQMRAGGKENYIILSTSSLFQEGYIPGGGGRGGWESRNRHARARLSQGCECLSMVDPSGAAASDGRL